MRKENDTMSVYDFTVKDRMGNDVKLSDLKISEHHSIRMRIGVKEDAEHMGGMNIFGKGFGNYDQGIILRTYF